ncbi:MAG: hypothetical protein MZV49_10760 [Rhodopseudomonas palustris]|nr:hypothetical protein [Rhodopseudomonas palustris]
MITGIDLVQEQIRIAAGATLLASTQDDVAFDGHAIECRINAENPRRFRPSPGPHHRSHPPGGLGVRVDSARLSAATRIPPYYDSLIGKLIVHGKTRNECLMRLRRALGEFVVDGIETTHAACSGRWSASPTSSTATTTSTGSNITWPPADQEQLKLNLVLVLTRLRDANRHPIRSTTL